MPLVTAVYPRGLIRTTGLVPASGDHSMNLVVFIPELPGTGLFATFWYYGESTGVYTNYVWIGQNDAGEVILEVDALGTVNAPDPGFGYHLISYTRSGNTHKMYIDGHLKATITADITAYVPVEEYIGTDTGSWVTARYKDFREWDSALTSDQLIIEAGLTTPVITPWCSTPLNGDLLDISGNNRDWAFFGGSSTYLIDGNMKQVMQGSSSTALQTNHITYLALDGANNNSSSILGGTTTPFRENCILRNINIEISPTPIEGAYWDFTLIKGTGPTGVDTVATFRIEPGDTFGSYTLSDISCLAGEWAVIKVEPSIGTPPGTTSITRFGWEQLLTDKFHTQFFVGANSSSINSYPEKFNGVFCGSGMWSRDIDGGPQDDWTICPLTGVITGITYQMKGGETFHRKLDADLIIWKSEDYGVTWIPQDGSGGTPNSEVNITPIGTTGTACFAAPDQAFSLISKSFQLVVRRGDMLYIQELTNAACGGQFNCNFAFTFNSSISNSYPVCGRSLSVSSTSSYKNFWGLPGYFGPGSINGRQSSNGGYSTFTLGQWISLLTVAPTSGKTRLFTAHTNGVDSSLQLTFNVGDLVAEDNHHFLDVVFGDYFGIHFTATSGTPGTEPIWGIVSSIAPTEGGGGGGGTGQITVLKLTDPPSAVVFDFTTDNLDPASFSLSNGQSIVFPDLNAGDGYGVTETPNPLYDTTYIVSNDSPHDNITVAEDEAVLVTVTNVLVLRPGAGIYKIIPNSYKPNDTLWVTLDPPSTEDVEIPRPFARTGLLGE